MLRRHSNSSAAAPQQHRCLFCGGGRVLRSSSRAVRPRLAVLVAGSSRWARENVEATRHIFRVGVHWVLHGHCCLGYFQDATDSLLRCLSCRHRCIEHASIGWSRKQVAGCVLCVPRRRVLVSECCQAFGKALAAAPMLHETRRMQVISASHLFRTQVLDRLTEIIMRSMTEGRRNLLLSVQKYIVISVVVSNTVGLAVCIAALYHFNKAAALNAEIAAAINSGSDAAQISSSPNFKHLSTTVAPTSSPLKCASRSLCCSSLLPVTAQSSLSCLV